MQVFNVRAPSMCSLRAAPQHLAHNIWPTHTHTVRSHWPFNNTPGIILVSLKAILSHVTSVHVYLSIYLFIYAPTYLVLRMSGIRDPVTDPPHFCSCVCQVSLCRWMQTNHCQVFMSQLVKWLMSACIKVHSLEQSRLSTWCAARWSWSVGILL